jgi:hypothetical protein
MTAGERRLAQRLEDKLDDDYLLWYDVPMGPKNAHSPLFPLIKPSSCTRYRCALVLHQHKLPFNVRKRSGDFNPAADAIQIMTMKVSKGLEFPVVALSGVGHMPGKGKDEQEAARVFYVAATRATQRLVIGVGGDGGFGKRLGT